LALFGNIAVGASIATKTFSKGITTLRGKMSGLVSSIGGLGSKFLSIAGPAAAAGAALVGVGGAAAGLSLGVKLAGEMEQAEIAFSTLLGSGDKAKAFLSELSSFAASTPFQLTDLRNSAQQLLAFGFNAKDSMSLIKTLGDVAAGTGKPLSEFVSIFGKIKAGGGFVSLGDLNMLADRSVPIFELLSKQLGVTAAEIKKMASTGKLSYDNMAKAMQTVTGEGGLFQGSMIKQSQSLFGLFSTMKDNIEFVLLELGQMLIKEFSFKDALTSVTTFAQSTLTTIQEWAPQIKAGFSVVKTFAVTLVDVIGSIFDSLRTSWGPIVSQFLPDFGSGFGSMKDAVLSTLIAVEYGLKNWRSIVENVFLKAYPSVAKNQAFTSWLESIPASATSGF